MVLAHAQRIEIAGRKVPLKVSLDVMGFAETVQPVDHPERVIAPVRRARDLLEVVRAADFVEVDELVRGVDESQRRLDVDRRLQRNPGEDAAFVERTQGRDAVCRISRVALPFARERRVEARQRRSEGVAVVAGTDRDRAELATRPWSGCRRRDRAR